MATGRHWSRGAVHVRPPAELGAAQVCVRAASNCLSGWRRRLTCPSARAPAYLAVARITRPRAAAAGGAASARRERSGAHLSAVAPNSRRRRRRPTATPAAATTTAQTDQSDAMSLTPERASGRERYERNERTTGELRPLSSARLCAAVTPPLRRCQCAAEFGFECDVLALGSARLCARIRVRSSPELTERGGLAFESNLSATATASESKSKSESERSRRISSTSARISSAAAAAEDTRLERENRKQKTEIDTDSGRLAQAVNCARHWFSIGSIGFIIVRRRQNRNNGRGRALPSKKAERHFESQVRSVAQTAPRDAERARSASLCSARTERRAEFSCARPHRLARRLLLSSLQ